MIEILKQYFIKAQSFLFDFVIAMVILTIGFKIVGLIEKSLRKEHKFSKLDPTAKTFLVSFFVIVLKILVCVIALQVVGVATSSIITVVGSCAVAIGLALQGGLSNIAGGIMILIFRPFKVGDYISNGTNEGTVKSITIFYTTIVMPDNKIVQFPNGALSNNTVVNYNANKIRRIDLEIAVSYKSSIKEVKKVINDVIKKHEKVLDDERNLVRLLRHGESSLVYAVKVWVNATDYWDVYYDLMEQIKDALDKNNIEIPYNQLDVHVIK